MTVLADVQRLGTMQLVEMFEWDARAIGGDILRWHAGMAPGDKPITWQGKIYQPFPIEAEGFETAVGGKLPRPTLRVSNIGGQMGAYLRSIADGLNAKVTRIRTLGKYLDPINFPGGNPNAADTSFPDDVYYVARKASENPIFIEMELAAKFDMVGVKLPRRQVIASVCQWVYRSAECSYAGPPVQDIDGNHTSDPDKDRCAKTLDACQARFGKPNGGNGVLRTSAFPASLLARQ
jgi:lambda family phage minor tail protein L